MKISETAIHPDGNVSIHFQSGYRFYGTIRGDGTPLEGELNTDDGELVYEGWFEHPYLFYIERFEEMKKNN